MVKPSELKEAIHQGITVQCSAGTQSSLPNHLVQAFFFTVRNNSSLTVQSLNLRSQVHETQHHLAGTKGSKPAPYHIIR
jgi:hypothetical protein